MKRSIRYDVDYVFAGFDNIESMDIVYFAIQMWFLRNVGELMMLTLWE